ncbi:CGNR zinc finger domain-containing protein [Micromonospora musae]|uniref:CGNR zinc finger domain-containing protein n=1 Tax=Micromonospora musae TaxID=1894970 RepID=UPI0033E905F1
MPGRRALTVAVEPEPAAAGTTATPKPRGRAAGHRSGLADTYRLGLRAAALANARLSDLADARALLSAHSWPPDGLGESDLVALRFAGRQLRKAFGQVAEGREREAVDRLNLLLARYRVRPVISGAGSADWHLHVAAVGTPPAVEFVAAAVWGLAAWLCERGIERLGLCADSDCTAAYLDDTSNRCRRFCGDRCATRSHVRAHRARRRAHDSVVSAG